MHFRILDGWRGVAALLVALFHLNLLSPIYSLDFVRNAFLFVDFFFVLSGFVITHSYGNRLETPRQFSSFAMRRLNRLWPLHSVVLLAFVIAEVAKAMLVARGTSVAFAPFTGPTSLTSFVVNLAFGQSFGLEQQLTWNSPSWSICAEFWTYLIFGSVVLVGTTRFGRLRHATVFFLAAILLGSVVVLLTQAKHGIDATYDLGLARCLYGFLVGHATYRLWQAASRTGFKAGYFEIGALLGMIVFVTVAGRSDWSFFAPLVFAPVVFIFAFEAGPVSRLMANRGIEWLGRISYSIYMWQAFVIFNLIDRPVSIFEKMTGHVLTTTVGAGSELGGEASKLIVLGGHVAPIVVTLLYLGLLVAIATVSYRLIEKPDPELRRRMAAARGLVATAVRTASSPHRRPLLKALFAPRRHQHRSSRSTS